MEQEQANPPENYFDPETGEQLWPLIPAVKFMEFLPALDEVGIGQIKELYQKEGKELTNDEAYNLLAKLIHLMWAVNRAHLKADAAHSIPPEPSEISE
jgi:hypothetical protein